MKKVLSWMLAVCLLCTLMLSAAVPASAMPNGEEQQIIKQMNGLLVGITGDMLQYGKVYDWSDETINRMISNKMMWDDYSYDPYLERMGISTDSASDGWIHLDREQVDSLVYDALDRNYVPVELPYMLKESGDEILFGMAAGEHTAVAVQDYIRQGSYYIAVGCLVTYGGAGSEAGSYFRAVFRVDKTSAFGMSLYSLEKITGNQKFDKLVLGASSELSGGDYQAKNAFDGDPATAWVEGASGTGEGEFIELNTADGSRLNLCAVEIDPGYHKNSDILAKNGWPTSLQIETDDLYMELNCYSTETQTLLFSVPSDTEYMRITIQQAQAGSKYTDTCISEIRLIGLDTDTYFNNLVLDLPEDAPAPDASVPEETQPQDTPVATAPEAEAAPEQSVTDQEDAASEESVTDAESTEEREEADYNKASQEIIVLDIMEKLEDNLLLVILVSAGCLVVAAGVAVLFIMKKKK